VNFPVSFSLTYPQIEAANMARLATEYTEHGFTDKRQGNYLKFMLDDYGYQDPNKFLEQLKRKDFSLPEKTRDVYFYLPLRMLNIYQTVRLFSNLDLTTGKRYAEPFLYQTQSFRDLGEKLLLGNRIELNKRTNSIRIGNRDIPINALYITAYSSVSTTLQVKKQLFDMTAPVSVVFMKSYNRFLVVDQQTLNSTYFQLFILEQYDPELFEPIMMTPLAKVYRLKK
jgi:hypothetical protein